METKMALRSSSGALMKNDRKRHSPRKPGIVNFKIRK